MILNSHQEAAIQHENAAKAHMIAAKHCEKEARLADLKAQQLPQEAVEPGSAWYHDAAVKDSGQAAKH